MATFINRVHFFIALLCIASILISGGAIDVGPPFSICIGQGPCPGGSDNDCGLYCYKNHFNKGGRCEASKCLLIN
ncbi:hypothetical protein P8452_56294 [Trifolium repens]|nr:hypothetical protein P8452_56294 [Trifolium repens]